MKPLHSTRYEHSKTEFGKKNSQKRIAESLIFSLILSFSSAGVTNSIRIFEEIISKVFSQKIRVRVDSG